MSAITIEPCWWSKPKPSGSMPMRRKRFSRISGAPFQRVLNEPSPSARLLMSGPGVFTVEIQRTIEREVWWLSTAAATMVFLFLYASYRSLTLVLLSLIPISSGFWQAWSR